MFRWLRRLTINMTVVLITRDQWHGWNDSDWDREKPDPPLYGLDDRCQVMDNIRWVAKQLQSADQLEYLQLTASWVSCWKHHEVMPATKDAEWLLQPFKCLRNIKELEIGRLVLDMNFHTEYSSKPKKLGLWLCAGDQMEEAHGGDTANPRAGTAQLYPTPRMSGVQARYPEHLEHRNQCESRGLSTGRCGCVRKVRQGRLLQIHTRIEQHMDAGKGGERADRFHCLGTA